MRGMSLLGLVIVALVIGLLVTKQTVGSRNATSAIGVPASAPQGNVREQSQQIQQQYKQALEGALNQPRPEPDDAK
ncbi:hypothetical protein FVQ98_08925 [Ottowia sp. GY511]|uniref:Uncharacterized protein n=1 Tax=Ottowia flava TaxID=2675430 RepID=A0ABW4KME5_9BURK|nr:hypothetical protein [Ottowia sp. GY511]TXK29630.1 hypothetical protein FVQ98_08925 [Ottowia sp. GY511]